MYWNKSQFWFSVLQEEGFKLDSKGNFLTVKAAKHSNTFLAVCGTAITAALRDTSDTLDAAFSQMNFWIFFQNFPFDLS